MISVLSLSAFKIHDQDVAGEKIARHDVKNETMTSLLSFETSPNLRTHLTCVVGGGRF
jgi:hypothetical protein